MPLLDITSIQRGCVYDGRGVRTTVFLKGCPLHCPWCCNPETLSDKNKLFIDVNKCLLTNGKVSALCVGCERNGGKISVLNCPFGVGQRTTKTYTAEMLCKLLVNDVKLFTQSNGGVTFSGGEPLLWVRRLLPLLQMLKQRDIDIAFETTLMVPTEQIETILPYSDEFMVDFKLQPQMNLYDQTYFAAMKNHYALLYGKRVVNRLVFVDEMLEHKNQILFALQELGITEIELLPCHNLGAKKYEKLALPHKDYSADKNKLRMFADYMKHNSIGLTALTL